jgi:hypothetical protein
VPPRRERLKVVTNWRCVLNKNDRTASPSLPHGQTIDTLDDGKKVVLRRASDVTTSFVCPQRLPFSRAGHNAPTPAWLKADVARVG